MRMESRFSHSVLNRSKKTLPGTEILSRARATVKDIARHAGVSPATVSLVLRNIPLVAEGTRTRIQSSITSLGYVYDRAAASLPGRLTHTMGLIVCEITNPFYSVLTAGIDDALDRPGWVAFLANAVESSVRQDRFIERMREHRVDGLLLSAAEVTDPGIVERLQRYGMLVVQILRRIGRRKVDRVGADFGLGMTLPAEHLIRVGHKRIAFVGPGRHLLRRSPIGRRWRAMGSGTVRSSAVCRPERGYRSRRRTHARQGDGSQILCFNDVRAFFGVMLGLADRRLEVGRDVAVTGFDNIDEAAYSHPRDRVRVCAVVFQARGLCCRR